MKKNYKNKILIIGALGALLFLTSCGKPVDLMDLQNRNGVFYSVNSQTPFSGKFYLNFKNGKVQEEGALKNGLLQGKFAAYYPNGQVKVQTAYNDGKINGQFIAFYENGERKSDLNYKNGDFDGVNVVYPTMFNPKYEVVFQNGRVVKEVKYNRSGAVISSSDISNPNFDAQAVESFFRTQVAVLNLL